MPIFLALARRPPTSPSTDGGHKPLLLNAFMRNHLLSAHPMHTFRVAIVGALTALASLVGPPVQAGPQTLTAGEMAMLPTYCPDTMGFGYGDASFNTSPRAGYWVGLMGKSFWHMHHHCLGILKIRRSSQPGVAAHLRRGLLESAVDEFNYVIEHSTPNFVMLPEVFRMRGDTLLKLGRLSEAGNSYADARRIKPDYAPAYINWADALVSTGLRKTAVTLLEDGLRAAPDSKELRASYAKVGGNVDAFVKALPPRPTRAVAASAPTLGSDSAVLGERAASSSP